MECFELDANCIPNARKNTHKIQTFNRQRNNRGINLRKVNRVANRPRQRKKFAKQFCAKLLSARFSSRSNWRGC